jgi:acetyltransferase
MTVRNLQHLFKPESIALIGASDRPGSIGAVVARNLRQGGFTGQVFPVNTRPQTVEGIPTFPGVSALPSTPDLAVICTPPDTVPGVIGQLGERW